MQIAAISKKCQEKTPLLYDKIRISVRMGRLLKWQLAHSGELK